MLKLTCDANFVSTGVEIENFSVGQNFTCDGALTPSLVLIYASNN